MALSHIEPRLAPIFPFDDLKPLLCSLRRCRSFSGYVPYDLQELHSCLEPRSTQPCNLKQSESTEGLFSHRLSEATVLDVDMGQLTGAPSSSEPAAVALAAAEATEDSTDESGSRASEPPSSPRSSEEQEPCGSGSELNDCAPQEFWPDTDSDTDEYDWTSSCARRRPAALASTKEALVLQPSASVGASPFAAGAYLTPYGQAPVQPGEAAPLLLAALLPRQQLSQPAANGGALVTTPIGSAAALLVPWPSSPSGAPETPAAADPLRSTMLAAEAALAALEAAEEELSQSSYSESPLAKADAPRTRAASAGHEEHEPAPVPAPTPALTKKAKSAAGRSTEAGVPSVVAKVAPQEVTSLMLRNLPAKLTQRELLDNIHQSGFDGKCDFCYMPRDFTTGENRGHAFVNFVSAEVATEFRAAWHRRRRFGVRQNQPSINISVADLQGLEENVRKWDNPRMRRVRNPEYKPFVLGRDDTACTESC